MISYAFKYRRYFSNGNNEAQVPGSRLQQSKDLDDLTIYINFEPVDYIVMGQNICRKITVAFYKCLHCSVHGGLASPPICTIKFRNSSIRLPINRCSSIF